MDGELKAGRHDADDRVLTSIQHDAASEHIRVAAKMFLPEIATDNDFESTGPAAGLFVIANESAANLWFNPEHIEELRAYFHPAQTGRSLLVRESEQAIAIHGAARKGAVLVSNVKEIRIRERVQLRLRPLLPRVGHADCDQLIGRRKRQRFKKDRVDDAEDGSVCADPEGESQHRDECECGMFPELA